jgi:hypothetical protein
MARGAVWGNTVHRFSRWGFGRWAPGSQAKAPGRLGHCEEQVHQNGPALDSLPTCAASFRSSVRKVLMFCRMC